LGFQTKKRDGRITNAWTVATGPVVAKLRFFVWSLSSIG
jgi:hypothetical protein